jgi:hypothetical protein
MPEHADLINRCDGGNFGGWIQDGHGLPAFRFEARLPARQRPSDRLWDAYGDASPPERNDAPA